MENVNIENNDDGISLETIFFAVKKHIIAIIAFVVAMSVVGVLFGIIKDKVKPQYTATATMMVTVEENNITMTQSYQYSNYISDTFAVFATEDVVVDPVAKKYGISTSALQENLTAKLVDDTLILSISYVSSDAQNAVDVVNDIVASTYEKANAFDELTQKSKYPLLAGNISSVTDATMEKVSKKSSVLIFALIGFAIGAVFAFLYVFLVEKFDYTFKSNDEVERELGIPVLADIPEYTLSGGFKDNVEGKEKKNGIK